MFIFKTMLGSINILRTFETTFVSEIGLYSSFPYSCSLFLYLSLLFLTGTEQSRIELRIPGG